MNLKSNYRGCAPTPRQGKHYRLLPHVRLYKAAPPAPLLPSLKPRTNIASCSFQVLARSTLSSPLVAKKVGFALPYFRRFSMERAGAGKGLRGGGAAAEDDGEKWVLDSSVDHRRRPPLRAATGSWKAAVFILCESRLSSMCWLVLI